jgi:hypothetical protein
MEEIIQEIADYIEDWTVDYLASSPGANVKNWGFAELVNREAKGKKISSQPIPMTINGTGDRDQISLDDRYDFIEWIRWISPLQSVANDEDSWGLREGKRVRLPLRIVIAHKVTLGENLIFDLVAGLPENLVISGFDIVFLNSDYSIDPDHEAIYKEELGETVYELHRFDWNVYVINLNVEFVKGNECIPDFYRLTETGSFRTLE